MHPPLENGARRGAQVRCPACTRFHTPGLLCPRCDCGPVPPERYGAARMLVHAGVDRYALADRVLLLPTSMAEQLEARYARMWAHVRRLLVDVRRYEQALLLRGFEEEVEDRWAQRLPWHVPEEEPAAEPEEGLHTAVPALESRWLAALVDVHEGTPSHEALDTVLTCLEDDGRFGCEAALALTRWRCGQARAGPGWPPSASRGSLAPPSSGFRSRGRAPPWRGCGPQGRRRTWTCCSCCVRACTIRTRMCASNARSACRTRMASSQPRSPRTWRGPRRRVGRWRRGAPCDCWSGWRRGEMRTSRSTCCGGCPRRRLRGR